MVLPDIKALVCSLVSECRASDSHDHAPQLRSSTEAAPGPSLT